jgi:hypothetical protein
MRASEVKLDATATLLEALVSRMPKSAERGGGRKKTKALSDYRRIAS